MSKARLLQVLYLAGGILLILVIEKKTGIFTKIFSKIPGVNTLLA
jgi:hypothetical protein